MPDSSRAAGAVFLSYASQDSEAAKHICDALRAAGVEVWFDQNELVGGDQWDGKIRGQIGSCALFLPIISANTQARLEGYFRLEWKLAAQRTHTMADEKAFLLPILVDDTRDAEAKVPAEFRAVQWTKLPAGEATPAFCARVKKLLQGSELEPGRPRSGHETRGEVVAPPVKTGPSKWWWVLPIFGVTMAMVLVMKESRKEPPPALSPSNGPASPVAPAAVSEARQLVERARGLMDKLNVLPGDLNTAAGMLEQAAQLAPNDALVWSTWALLDLRYVSLDFDNTPSRHNAARAHAAQANALDPASRETRYTQAEVMRSLAWDPATQAAAEKILRPMLTEAPEDGRVLIQLGWVAFAQGRLDVAVAHFERAALLPACAVHATYCKALVLGLRNHFEACDRALDQLLVLAPTHAFGLCQKAALSWAWHGDLEASRAFIERVPPQMRVEDMSASFAYGVYMTRREYDQAVQAIRAVPRDYLSAQPGPGPSGFYIGEALAAAGKNAAAEIEWRSALATVERRLAEAPSDETLMKFKALLLARLDDRVAAERVWKAVVELHGDKAWGNMAALLHVVFLSPDEAIAWLNDRLADPQYWFTAAILRLSPLYDPLRSNPKFTALVEKMEADPRFSPKAKQRTENGGRKTDAGGQPSLPQSLSPSDRPSATDPKSVAVLAFANLSDDKGNEYFSDGISEELLNVLAKVPGLKVSARTSSFHFKGKDTPIPEIAQQLGVAYVIEGSVRKQGDKVRITAQLIKAADGFHVWSDTFTRDLKDIFAVQDEIAGLIAQQLQLKLGGTAEAKKVVNPEAYRLVLEGRHYWNQRTDEAFARAQELYAHALEIDPGFADAHAGIADVFVVRGWYHALSGASATTTDFARAREEATIALRLDPTLVAPHATLAAANYNEGRFPEAELAFKEALRLNPNYAVALHWRSHLLMAQGRPDEALASIERSIELDPFSSVTLVIYANWLEHTGRNADAVAVTDRALALRTDQFVPLYGTRALALWNVGRRDEAVAAARVVTRDPKQEPRWWTDGSVVYVLRQAGLVDEARAHLEHMLPGLSEGSTARAAVFAGMGEPDRAIAELARPERRLAGPGETYYTTPWATTRQDKRYAQLMDKLGRGDTYRRAQETLARMLKEQGATK